MTTRFSTIFRNLRWVSAAGMTLLFASAGVAKKPEVKTVTTVGQAAILGGDMAQARDKAIEDGLRKAVEQAVGTMVSSETVTENYQLISDKIYSKAKGYVKNYKVVSESKDDGVFVATIKANVSTGPLQDDLDGIMTTLRAKNMPRVLIMVAEQNVGQSEASGWWGSGTFSSNLDAVENAFINAWVPKGFTFVDRQALMGKLQTGPALKGSEPSEDDVKEFALTTGAELVIIGKAIATDVGNIMGSRMRSIRGNMSIRALRLDNGRIIGTSIQTKTVGHVDLATGGTKVLQEVAQAAAQDLLTKIMAAWQSEIASGTTITLKVANLKGMGQVRKMVNVLKEQVRGVQDIRQRSYKKRVAELEVDIKGSSQDLAIELEEKRFPGFSFEIDEISDNVVSAVLK